ncbi:hypothetical protein COCSUDRAFT_33288 [Coccomyxa subellipsoidea C-169]|uniref:Uncharacterized protein n=1 Tax=Coccomyxa subellipsoidea (strain C-169) TaxID=574566 RepID=I0YXV8_COCSC|nr:hypothetical protein COCSUDRAFT_33288 [Coccomyxa subellipsoidea C-169]EIE23227.1 hypothetical protein COCSUDRAFT_33288 [Coccomyxa subellipsoidea C-169]|eukprot:XP_005647771.1 hypothetical protein COCSUDRAFT_33288 [Coccomyxa subellipsoidea C-169]
MAEDMWFAGCCRGELAQLLCMGGDGGFPHLSSPSCAALSSSSCVCSGSIVWRGQG